MSKWENVGKIQGEKGDKGDKGDRGERGEQGVAGLDGQDAILNSDSNSVTFNDGTKIIRGTANLLYSSPTLLRAEIDYPPFTGQPTIVHSFRSLSNASRNKVKFPYTTTVGTTQTIIYIYGEGFEEDDSLEIHYIIMGRV